MYVEPIVTYYWCKILILSILSVIKDWGCKKEFVILFIYLFILLCKYYALSCLIVLKEWYKENCDKKPINSYSCKYLCSTHFTINKLKSWIPHAYYYISSSKLNCCIFSCLSTFQRTQIVPKTLSGLVNLRLLGLPAKTTGWDITVLFRLSLTHYEVYAHESINNQ